VITARTNTACTDGPHIITLTIVNDDLTTTEHKATLCSGHEDPRAIGSRWEAIANALIASGLRLCDQMAREAWFASICATDNPTLSRTADRARGIVAGHIGPERLNKIYQNAA
jgi:hypothetical protein